MRTYRFWIAVALSGGVHVLAILLVVHPWTAQDSAPELIEPFGDSDREGFQVDVIALNPGTYRQGDQHTPGGDDVPETKAPEPDQSEDRDEPLKPEAPAPQLPMTSLPAFLPTPTPAPAPPPTNRQGLPGASGGSDMPLGTPSSGGTVGRPTGLKLLQHGRKVYPAEAARLGQEGKPQVWLHISEDGDVIEARLHRSCSYPLLDAAAVRFAQTMKFRPARKAGSPVECVTIQAVEYELP